MSPEPDDVQPPAFRRLVESHYAERIAAAREAEHYLFEPTGRLEGKTVAATADGIVAVSGWSEGRSFPQATEAVRVRGVEIGYEFEPYFRDPVENGRKIDGVYYASHAEKQVSELAPNQPIAVNEDMCKDCQNYFQKLADYRDVAQVVKDPQATRLFIPGGTTVTLREQPREAERNR